MRTYLISLTAAVCLTQLTSNPPKNIHGTVYDAINKKPLAGVTVKLDGSPITAYTDSRGYYEISPKANNQRIIFLANGYKPDTIMTGKSSLMNVYLKRASNYNVDTVYYWLNNQQARSNASVDEMIKKPEGFQIDNNGNVSFQGQLVTKARINGKDYTGGDVAQSARNLPSDILERIRVVDDYGDMASMTGIKTNVPADKKFNEVVIQNTVSNNESYSPIIENQFINPLKEPLSTLATDVDAASYANVRRYINSGQLPPKNAVRIEEMINYFKYDLREPAAGKPVAIQTEVVSAPWNPKHQLVRIGLKAKNVDSDKLPPSNLVFLIDVSGSMESVNKLPLVKTSLKMLVDQLRAQDNVAMVVYAGAAGLVLPSTSGDQKQKIKDAIDQLSAGGSTAGGAGIKLAYSIARQNFKKKGNNRIVLATDGDFNVGQSSDQDMETLIEQERQSGVSISILGFGMGNYKDSKMEILADKGHGNYSYIDNITEATRAMVTEFGGTLFTVAKDVKLQVEFNPAKVQAYRLLGYEDRLLAKEDFNNDAKLGGDMGVNHTVTALYEIIPAGVKDDAFAGSVDPLKYQKETAPAAKNSSDELMTVKFRYKEPNEDVSKMESFVVKNVQLEFDESSEDFRFVAAVAEYGLLLRNSQFKQNASFEQVISLAKAAKGKDEQGYRAEFIRLAESTRDMAKSNTLAAER